MSVMQTQDPAVFESIEQERNRQRFGLEMIASENYTSRAVMEACGSVLTNKYAEGYPGRRYYGGCQHVDTTESIAIDRAKELFGCDSVNVQAHSGSQANTAVYLSCLEYGDCVMGLDLAHGGHLTHGMHLNISGILYDFVSYGVDAEMHRIDMDQVAKLAKKHKPKLIVAGASAYPREMPHDEFAQIAEDVGALLFVDMAHYAGLVAAGVHHNPVACADFVATTTHKTLRGPRGGMVMCKDEHIKAINRSIFPGLQGGPLMHIIAGKAICFGEALTDEFKEYGQQTVDNAKTLAAALQAGGMKLVSGGTDNHLMLLDVAQSLGMGGKLAEAVLDQCGITVNKNMIPFDERKPNDPSGIRIGTPALTTRKMGATEMNSIANWMISGLQAPEDTTLHTSIHQQIRELCGQFPVPEDKVISA